MLVIKYVFRVPLRMSEEMLLIGDDAVHGEDAYCFSDYPETVDTPGQVRDIEAGNGGGESNGKDPAPKEQ